MAHAVVMQVTLVGDVVEGMKMLEALQPPPGGPTVINCAVFEIAREV